MREVIGGDIWDYHKKGAWVVIPTNCEVDRKGFAIMGAGLALQAAERFPSLKKNYGRWLRENGSTIFVTDDRLILLPTKESWKENSNLALIEKGLEKLAWWFSVFKQANTRPFVAVPRLGCGLGNLNWEDVKPVMEKHLVENNFAVIL